MRTPNEPVYEMDHLVYSYSLDSPACFPFQFPNQTFEFFLDFNELDFDPDDPNARILFAMDWSLFRPSPNCSTPGGICPFDFAFGEFNMGVSTQRNVAMHSQAADGHLIQITDPIVDTDGNPFSNVEYGGILNLTCDLGQPSTNVWDITDFEIPASGQLPATTIKEAIAADPDPSPPNVTINGIGGVGNVEMTIRSIALYVASRSLCEVGTPAFGARPSAADFHIAQYDVSSDGEAVAILDVPNAWGSAERLNSDFSVEWYLKGNGAYTSIFNTGTTDARLLTAQFNIFDEGINLEDLGLDVTDIQVVAVVRHDGDFGPSFVETSSAPHFLSYAQTDVYQNQESGLAADSILDPGERRVFTYTLTNSRGGTLSGATLSLDFSDIGDSVIDFNGQAYTSSDAPEINLPTLSAGASTQQALNFRLISSSISCDNIVIPVTTAFSDGATEVSYENQLTLPINCGTAQFLDSDLSGWESEIFEIDGGFITEIPPSPGSVEHGWTYNSANNQWAGSTNLKIYFYTVTSPAYPTGITGTQSVFMRHFHRFPRF